MYVTGKGEREKKRPGRVREMERGEDKVEGGVNKVICCYMKIIIVIVPLN